MLSFTRRLIGRDTREFLKVDFPRLPLCGDPKLFRDWRPMAPSWSPCTSWNRPSSTNSSLNWRGRGDNLVETIQYTEKDGRVWINKKQYFGGVPQAVWDFRIGGYQVCHKWLKDRKGRQLTYDDLQHYQKVVVALHETVRLMAEIDETIEQHGGWPIG